MSKEIKVGVIGCGAIGKQHIARLMNTIPETRVVAVADYYQPAAEAVAAQYGITCCATGEELIALPEVEAVLVASADPSHAGYVLECVKAGKFVFCEKPLAQTAQECEQIISAEVAAVKRNRYSADDPLVPPQYVAGTRLCNRLCGHARCDPRDRYLALAAGR